LEEEKEEEGSNGKEKSKVEKIDLQDVR